MSVFTKPKIDSHNHIFDPLRFPYQPGSPWKRSGHEVGTADLLVRVMDAQR
jgi:hypothetical protein